MSYLENRLRALPIAFLVLAIYAALPSSFIVRWGDGTFISLVCLTGAIFYWPEAYFRRRIAGGRRKRNLAANWAGLLVSTGVAAAYAQHQSATTRGLFRGTRWNGRLGIILVLLVFMATYGALWLAYTRVMRHRRLARRNRSVPDSALR